jgi:hypothetical protein
MVLFIVKLGFVQEFLTVQSYNSYIDIRFEIMVDLDHGANTP